MFYFVAKSQGRENEGKGNEEEKYGKQYEVVPGQCRIQIDDEQFTGRAGDLAGVSAERRRKPADQLQKEPVPCNYPSSGRMERDFLT